MAVKGTLRYDISGHSIIQLLLECLVQHDSTVNRAEESIHEKTLQISRFRIEMFRVAPSGNIPRMEKRSPFPKDP